jgi:hypothetical protein
MPFQKNHKLNVGRLKDTTTRQLIGQKNSLRLHCPYCSMITTRARLAAHLTKSHPSELQYNDFNDFYIQSLIATEEAYQKYLIEKTSIDLQKKLSRKFTENYLEEIQDPNLQSLPLQNLDALLDNNS